MIKLANFIFFVYFYCFIIIEFYCFSFRYVNWFSNCALFIVRAIVANWKLHILEIDNDIILFVSLFI